MLVETKRKYIFILVAILLIFAYPLLRSIEWHGSASLHTLMETIATLLAIIVGILSLMRYYANKSNQLFLFIGVGFLGTAFLDAYHTIVTSLFFTELFPSAPPSIFPWSWMASRLFLSICLFWSYIHFRYRNNTVIDERRLYTFVSIGTLATFIFFVFVSLPDVYYDELTLHRPEELIPALFFSLALYGYLAKGNWKNDIFEYWLTLSLVVSVITQIVFMSFSGAYFDIEFDAAHLLKKVSYILVLIGLLKSIYELVLHEKIQKKELIKKRNELKEAQKIAELGSFTLELQTRIWTSSKMLDQLFGIDTSYERSIEGWGAIIHPDDRVEMDQYLINEVLSQGKLFDKEYRIIRQDDQSMHWMHGLGKLELDSNGLPIRMVGTVQDITKQKLSSDLLLKLSLAVEQSPNSIVITNLDGKIEYVNSMFTKVSGYSKDEALTEDPCIFKSGKILQSTYDDIWAHLSRGDTWQGELINRRKDNSTYCELTTISPVKQLDGKITNYVATKEDITERKHDQKRIKYLANFDVLTGLPNRIQLERQTKYAINVAKRKNGKLALLFLDLDHFKDINDTLGHRVGDMLLIRLAKRFRSIIREEDVVSRLGGDEFIFMVPHADVQGITHLVQKLLSAIAKPTVIEHNELIVTASIGIALYPIDGRDYETLTKNADTAMYRAKQDGRNNYCFFTEAMQKHSTRNLQLTNALRHALERKQLHMVYQPQISLHDGRIIGAEALLRWTHPELGNISPAEFIPLAEVSGLILPIGEWVLRTAVKQAKYWIEHGLPPMFVAVNLSAAQFRHPHLSGLVADILEEIGLAPEYLELELTEAAAMADPKSAYAVMDSLNELGVRMSIDDFGTGYSSLSYLKKFKVHKLKIDQSFVHDIHTDSEDKAIVNAIINMAHSLGLKTIAEGVETLEQLNYLREQGCDEIQGYYYSKPLSEEAFETFVKEKRNVL